MPTLNVLVCGGAGYIGAQMCKRLDESGHHVTVLDNLSTGHADAVRWGRLIEGDVLTIEDLDRAFRGETYDAVMHFCARSLVGESVLHPDIYYRNNVVGTQNLLDAMRRHGSTRLVFSSTAAVYGSPTHSPIDERHPIAPINPYGQSKRMAETLLFDYAAAFGITGVALRYFNAAGADPDGSLGERHEPETHLIPNVLKSAKAGSGATLKIFGDDYDTADGTCIRDYVHVLDICDAHLLAVRYLLNGGTSDVFNLGSGNGFSVLEVIRTAENVTGRTIPYSIEARREGDPPILVASSEKAKQTLSWTPRYTDLSAIIDTAWRWHDTH